MNSSEESQPFLTPVGNPETSSPPLPPQQPVSPTTAGPVLRPTKPDTSPLVSSLLDSARYEQNRREEPLGFFERRSRPIGWWTAGRWIFAAVVGVSIAVARCMTHDPGDYASSDEPTEATAPSNPQTNAGAPAARTVVNPPASNEVIRYVEPAPQPAENRRQWGTGVPPGYMGRRPFNPNLPYGTVPNPNDPVPGAPYPNMPRPGIDPPNVEPNGQQPPANGEANPQNPDAGAPGGAPQPQQQQQQPTAPNGEAQPAPQQQPQQPQQQPEAPPANAPANGQAENGQNNAPAAPPTAPQDEAPPR